MMTNFVSPKSEKCLVFVIDRDKSHNIRSIKPGSVFGEFLRIHITEYLEENNFPLEHIFLINGWEEHGEPDITCLWYACCSFTGEIAEVKVYVRPSFDGPEIKIEKVLEHEISYVKE